MDQLVTFLERIQLKEDEVSPEEIDSKVTNTAQIAEENDGRSDPIIEGAVEFIKTITRAVEKRYVDPIGFLEEVSKFAKTEFDVKTLLDTKGKIHIRSGDIDDILRESNLFSCTSKCIGMALGFVKERLSCYTSDENESYLIEVVTCVSSLFTIVQWNELPDEEVMAINNEICIFLCYLVDLLSSVTNEMLPYAYRLPFLIYQLLLKFIKIELTRELLLNYIIEKVESINKSGILKKNILLQLSGVEIESFVHYALILKSVLEERFFNPKGHNTQHMSKLYEENVKVRQLLCTLKPYVNRQLRYVFDECIMYLVTPAV